MLDKTTVQALPRVPGVYIFKDRARTILYIGKAKDLRQRVGSYLTSDHPKVQALLENVAVMTHIATQTETEALLLEADLIRQYKPPYNDVLKEGNPFFYIVFTSQTERPQMKLVRTKRYKGTYFGPFIHKKDARAVYEYLMATFALYTCNKSIEGGCLDYHLGTCAGTCRSDFDPDAYATRLELAMYVLRGDHRRFLRELDEAITAASKQLLFERASHLAQYKKHFEVIFATVAAKFKEHAYADEVAHATLPQDLPSDEATRALEALRDVSGCSYVPRTIDCFDVSHFQSTHLVGSCIRFTQARPEKNKFRRFAITSLRRQHDYAALQEIIARRYRRGDTPDVVCVDGGKGQRNAALQVVPEGTCVISLAKREERVHSDVYPEGVRLDMHTPLGRLLIALRDYAHHFAVSYHRLKRSASYRR